jgi:hypothetical protein
MKKLLRLEIKQNLRRSPRVYVKSIDLKTIYGSFHVDAPDGFEGWGLLSSEQTIELKQFMQNLIAVYQHLNPSPANTLTDFRFRLPYEFLDTLEQIEILCHKENVELNVFDSMITSMIQQIKIATSKLSGHAKEHALTLLDRANLAEYKKIDFSSQIKAIFAELQAIHNRSEKLHLKARDLYNKDKSYSPLAIKGMAEGETTPSKWLVSCAIDILMDERSDPLNSMLSNDDLFMLWAKPLLKEEFSKEILISKAQKLEKNKPLIDRIAQFNPIN